MTDQISGNYNDYYRDGLRYLGCVALNDLPGQYWQFNWIHKISLSKQYHPLYGCAKEWPLVMSLTHSLYALEILTVYGLETREVDLKINKIK